MGGLSRGVLDEVPVSDGSEPFRDAVVDPLLRGLSDEQRRAVLAPAGPLLILAGAGSGKTRTLLHRVAHVLRQGLSCDRVLLVTFTNHAARQMRDRLQLLQRQPVVQMWVGTFHRLALRALRLYGQHIGLSPRSGVIDHADSVDLFASCLHEQRSTLPADLPRPLYLHSLLSLSVATEESLESVLSSRAPELLGHLPLFSQVCDRYSVLKVRMGLLDFDDLLLAWRLLLCDSREVRERFQSQFQHVFVDEYQDVSPLQSIIADELAGGYRSLTVVGDDAQSIYRFRGADLRAIHSFALRWPDAQRVHLSVNYRCQPDIVALSNRCLLATPTGQLLPRPPMRAQESPSLSLRPAVVHVPDARVQAAFVLSRIVELRQAGQPLSDIAVLYRHHRHARELQAELLRAGIPYALRSGRRLIEQAHVKDVLALLRIANDPRDELSWSRALRQVAGLGDQGRALVLHGLKRQIEHGESPSLLRIAGVRKSAQAGLLRLDSLLSELFRLRSEASQPGFTLSQLPARLIQLIVERHYREHALLHFADAELRLRDLRLLTETVSSESHHAVMQSALPLPGDGAQTALGDFLCALTMGEDSSQQPEEKVILSSVHQSKGLEWNTVFVLWLAEGHFPSATALSEDDEDLGSGGEAEERRLFYVAITRARRELYLCCPGSAVTQGALRVSRYVGELCGSDPLCERWSVSAQPR